MGDTALEASAPGNSRPLGFLELQANITGGIVDRTRLAAKFFVAKMANTAHELLVDLPAAVLKEDDLVSYQIARAERNVETLTEVGAWAVGQEIVPPGATAPLPRYQKLF